MATPVDVLGSRLKSFFNNNYSAGTWTDDIAGAQMSQGTVGARPTAGTLPDGSLDLTFDGTDDSLLGQWATTNDLGGYHLYFMIWSIHSASTSRQVLLRGDGGSVALGVDLPIAGNNNFYVQTSAAEQVNIGGSYRDSTRHRLVYIEDYTGNIASYSIDAGALTTITHSSPLVDQHSWTGAACKFGTNLDDTARLQGTLAKVGFAYSASAFTQSDVDGLNSALNEYLGVYPAVSNSHGLMGFI